MAGEPARSASNTLTDHQLETYKALLATAGELFKYLALTNGGAAVALLSYLATTKPKAVAPDVKVSMMIFLGGVAACGVGQLLVYFTHATLFLKSTGQKTVGSIDWYRNIAIFFVIASLVAFVAGCWMAVNAL